MSSSQKRDSTSEDHNQASKTDGVPLEHNLKNQQKNSEDDSTPDSYLSWLPFGRASQTVRRVIEAPCGSPAEADVADNCPQANVLDITPSKTWEASTAATEECSLGSALSERVKKQIGVISSETAKRLNTDRPKEPNLAIQHSHDGAVRLRDLPHPSKLRSRKKNKVRGGAITEKQSMLDISHHIAQLRRKKAVWEGKASNNRKLAEARQSFVQHILPAKSKTSMKDTSPGSSKDSKLEYGQPGSETISFTHLDSDASLHQWGQVLSPRTIPEDEVMGRTPGPLIQPEEIPAAHPTLDTEYVRSAEDSPYRIPAPNQPWPPEAAYSFIHRPERTITESHMVQFSPDHRSPETGRLEREQHTQTFQQTHLHTESVERNTDDFVWQRRDYLRNIPAPCSGHPRHGQNSPNCEE